MFVYSIIITHIDFGVIALSL